MPEGPELHLASRFINNVCKGRIFGKICKSDISKNPAVAAPFPQFSISSCSRGKEVKLILTENRSHSNTDKKTTTISGSLEVLFTFGLAGKFDFCSPDELQKHSHLCFYTVDSKPEMVLSFVDYMRFGKWTPGATWSRDRGPCVLFDYSSFRSNVLNNMEASVFNKPICEVLLNQKYFSGIGNYLRAEILYRHGTPPFVSARSVLEPLVNDDKVKVKSETPDILQLCNIVAMEVIRLEGDGYDLQDRADETKTFNVWLQCYYQDGMKNMADHNGRTIWYHGPAGPLAPKDVKTRAKKSGKKKKKATEKIAGAENESTETGQTTQAQRGKRKGKRKEKDQELSSEIKPELVEDTKTEKRKRQKRTKESGEIEPDIIVAPKKVKKASKKMEQTEVNRKDPVSSEHEIVSLSISDLKLDVVMNSKRLTRGRLKSVMVKGDNFAKSPAARTKTKARTTKRKT